MKNNQIYPDGTFEDIISFPFNADRIIGIVVGVVLLSGIFFLATPHLSEIWSEENLRSTDGQFSFPFNFSGKSWNIRQTEYNPETKQFLTKKMWNEGYYE